jgi:hypothetical protein
MSKKKKISEASELAFPDLRPDIIITITGLLVVKFNDQSNVCQIGIHPDENHCLRMGVELRKRPDGANDESDDDPIIHHWSYSFYNPLDDTLTLNVIHPAPKWAGIRRLERNDLMHRKEILSQNAQDMPELRLQRQDYRWVLRLSQFHSQELKMPDSVFNSCVQINNGLFYTHKLFQNEGLALSRIPVDGMALVPVLDPSEDLINAGVKKAMPDNVLLLQTVAEEIGAKIYLDPNNEDSEMRWQWTKVSKKRRLFPFSSLKRPSVGHYYKVTLNNNCRLDDIDECANRIVDQGYKSDLPLYYELLSTEANPLPKEQWLDLTAKPDGSQTVPCSPVGEP